MSRFQFSDTVAVITGSTGGLGRSLAERLLAKGMKIALCDVQEEALSRQNEQLTSKNQGHVSQHLMDVTDYDNVHQVMEEIHAEHGRIDLVIANAGTGTIASVRHMEPAHFDKIIDVNLNGVWRTFKAAIPYVTQTQGHLVGISSMGGFAHSPLQTAYTSSKAAVWALCNSLRLELRADNVTVSSIHPTFFKTPMMEKVLDDEAGTLLWNGNEQGLWKMTDHSLVINEIMSSIERRKAFVVIPKASSIVAYAPSVFRSIIDRDFKDYQVRQAERLAHQRDTENAAEGRSILDLDYRRKS